MKLSVIVPVLNGIGTLPKCLKALNDSARPPDELIVVDDGSTDASATAAEQAGAMVLHVAGGPRGPAAARNLGVKHASGDVLVFVDADVTAHRDTLERIADRLESDPELGAVFGSYDDAPTALGVISQYKNLLHHYVHQTTRGEASTFWAGCGAVRREAFEAVGGFDAETYASPSIEDIELGVRLRKAGYRIRCCPEVLATHAKRWTLAGWIRTDVALRAVPWTRLILREGSMPDDLNLDVRSRACAVASLGALGSGVFAPWYAWAGVACVLGLTFVLACNAGLFRLFYRRGGFSFAAACLLLHVTYYVYSSLTFTTIVGARAVAKLREFLRPFARGGERRGPSSGTASEVSVAIRPAFMQTRSST